MVQSHVQTTQKKNEYYSPYNSPPKKMIWIYNPLRIYITHLAKGIMTESTFKTAFLTWTNNRIGSTNGLRTVGIFSQEVAKK